MTNAQCVPAVLPNQSPQLDRRRGRLVGEHRSHTRCRFCLAEALHPFLDFGLVPLAGGFFPRWSTPESFQRERLYPLRICVCTRCWLVQVDNAVPADVLFRDYFYFSSSIPTLAAHFRAYAMEVGSGFSDPTRASVLELGCNDGVFLRPLRSAGLRVIGVDPAANVVAPLIREGFTIVNDYFSEAVARDILHRHGPVDAIISSNSFAHIDDMHEVMRGVDVLLKPDGYLAFEVHYLGTLIEQSQYDMMYHEHLCYYSLAALEPFLASFGMDVFDVRHLPIHGGSVRFLVQRRNTGTRAVTPAVQRMRNQEVTWGCQRITTYDQFRNRIDDRKAELLSLLDDLIKQGKRIVGYGASGRATMLSTYCRIGAQYLEAVVDDAPAKQGAFTPGTHLPIISSNSLNRPDRPDYALVFAWTFAADICARNRAFLCDGGRFIVPLPQIRVIDGVSGW